MIKLFIKYLVHSLPTVRLVPDDFSFEAAGDEHVVARVELGADHEVLVDAQALAHVEHRRRPAGFLHALGQLAAGGVESQQAHAAPEWRAHYSSVRRVTQLLLKNVVF